MLKPLEYFKILKNAGSEFISDNAIKLCSSLAFYTVFAIGPFLLVIISVAGLFFEKQTITLKIYDEISSLIGQQGAQQVLKIIQNMQEQNTASKYTIIGSIVLVIGASGVFAEIQDSINYIFSIKPKPKRGWLEYLRNRFLSFSLVMGLGFLLIVSLFVNTTVDVLTARLLMYYTGATLVVFKTLNVVLLYVVISGLFAVIYKVLPDALIKWKDAFVGAGFTGALFLLGKFLIGVYLGNSNLGIIYGTAASFIIILSWVYYSSVILYFGAEFTKEYALKIGGGIEPYRNAVFIIKKEAKELPNSSGTEA